MKNFSKFLAIVLSIAITVPMLALSAGAVDSLTAEEPQIISDTLQAVMEASTEETTRVAVWLKDIETEEALATNSMPSYQERLAVVTATEANSTATNEIDRSIEVKRTALNLCYEPYTEAVGASYFTEDEIVYASEYLPIVLADLTDERVAEIAELDVVEKIDYYNDDFIGGGENAETEPQVATTTGLANMMASRNSEVTPLSVTITTSNGTEVYYTVEENMEFVNADDLWNVVKDIPRYVNVGMIDAGIPDISSDAFENVQNSVMIRRTSDLLDSHATHDLEILTKVCPSAYFYCTSLKGNNATLVNELEWLLERNTSVISISLYRLKNGNNSLDPDANNVYGACAALLDRVSVIYGTTILIASGNGKLDGEYTEENTPGVTSGAMGYNVITVGNYNRYTQEIDDTSMYNTSSSYAKKPDISAPGYFQLYGHTCGNYSCTDPDCQNGTCADSMGLCCKTDESMCCSSTQSGGHYIIGGTSQATPLVAGIVAQLMIYHSPLKTRPQLVKAILMAGVGKQTSHLYIPGDANYIKYGAGIVDAWNAYTILNEGTYATGTMSTGMTRIYQTIPLQRGDKTRVSFIALHESTERYITTPITTPTAYGRGYVVWYYLTALQNCASIGVNQNIALVTHTPETTGNYEMRIDATEDTNFYEMETTVTSIPYAIAWIQYD